MRISKKFFFWNKTTNEWEAISGIFCGYEDELTLDESLDMGKARFVESRQKRPFVPFTPLKLVFTDLDTNKVMGKEYYVVADCDTHLWSLVYTEEHGNMELNFSFIEATKMLERTKCDTLTFTNYLAHTYPPNATKLEPKIIAPGKAGEAFSLSSSVGYFSHIFEGESVNLIPFDELILKTADLTMQRYYILNKQCSLDTTGEGDKIIAKYAFTCKKTKLTPSIDGIFEGELWKENVQVIYEIGILHSIGLKPYYTISQVLNRILEVGKTRRNGVEEAKYKLAEDIEERYKDVQAPEFHITRSSLFEALLQVGNYIHAIPRLVWNEQTNKFDTITFDKLGTEEDWQKPDGTIFSGQSFWRSMEEYCGGLDIYAENIINTTNISMGAVKDVKTTPRTEDGQFLIYNDNVVIRTDKPMYRLIKLEVTDFSKTEDITPYVYESAEYGTLSAFSDVYPYAKSYALTYRQGDRKITGLNFVKDEVNGFSSNYSLVKILKRVGINISSLSSFKNLGFKVTYIPITSARVVQKKAYEGDFDLENSNFYNQNENTIENSFFGEHVKGVLAMSGNEVEIRKYAVYGYAPLPKLGQMIEGKYISNIKRDMYPVDHINVILTLTENFNKLNTYYALKSNYRLFDVSEKQSVDRAINYSEDIIIGDEISENNADNVSFNMQNVLIDTITNSDARYAVNAISQGFNKSNTAILKPIIHSCTTTALGNSIIFNWKNDDNYSAGVKTDETEGTVKYSQKLVQYGDNYGELHYLKLHLVKDKDLTLAEAKNVPEYEYDFGNTDGVLFDYATKPLIIRKDSRECLNITTQVNFISNRKSVIIGRALTQYNKLVNLDNIEKLSGMYPAIIMLPYRINMLNSRLDTTNAEVAKEVGVNFDGIAVDNTKKLLAIRPFRNTTNNTYKSWALVLMKHITDSNGDITEVFDDEFFVAENIELPPNAMSNAVVMTARANK